jgi:hypothetical protein
LKLLLLLSLIFSFSLFAAENDISDDQIKVLNTVRNIAKTIPDAKGKTYEDTISAICLTESSAGQNLIGDFHKNVPLTKASLGVMQIQVQTVRYVASQVKKLNWIHSLNDSQIANRLLTDSEFSARIATHYFILLRHSRKNYMSSISGYNGGMTNTPYFEKVTKSLEDIKTLKKEKKLS